MIPQEIKNIDLKKEIEETKIGRGRNRKYRIGKDLLSLGERSALGKVGEKVDIEIFRLRNALKRLDIYSFNLFLCIFLCIYYK